MYPWFNQTNNRLLSNECTLSFAWFNVIGIIVEGVISCTSLFFPTFVIYECDVIETCVELALSAHSLWTIFGISPFENSCYVKKN